MENTRRLREKYSMNAAFEQSVVLSPDELFVLKVKELIEQNIDDENFATEQLAESVGMNRTQLYRKLMALTNLSVSDFIRHYRLNRAKQYFEKGGYTVSEVAFKVGFKDPSYFSKCFMKEYGVSPSKLTDGLRKMEN
jgi:AraC-like DNA-binding protein